MASFKIDTDNVRVMAAAIKVLAINFETQITYPDKGKCRGDGISELKPLCEKIELAKEQLSLLMQMTVSYLTTTSAAFDKSDVATAAELLIGSGIIDDPISTK